MAFSYVGENEDELSLDVDEIVTIIKEIDEGWWEGELNGKRGLLPSNFVTMIEEEGTQRN